MQSQVLYSILKHLRRTPAILRHKIYPACPMLFILRFIPQVFAHLQKIHRFDEQQS